MLTESIPNYLILALPQLGLIFVGIIIERYYVSRATSFTNALALVTHIASQPQVGFWLGIYVDLGLLMGVVGILAYLTETSLRKEYYLASLFLYSGLSVGAVILWTDQWVIMIVISGILTILTSYFSSSNFTLVYTESLNGAVHQYAKGVAIEHINHETGYRAKIDLLEAIKRG